MSVRPETPSLAHERRRAPPRALRGLAVAATVFALLAGYVLYKWRDANTFPLRAVSQAGKWIQAPGVEGYAGFFRRTLHLPATVKSAWIAIAACDGFEIIVNGDPVARQYLWRPTRPFQNGLSEKGQRFVTATPAMGLNFPREYQWSGHDMHRFPVWVDIRPELIKGKNTICVQVESRRAPAKFAMTGEILLSTGQRIVVESSSAWKSEPVPPGLQDRDWTNVTYDDRSWRPAQRAVIPRGKRWRDFDVTLFKRPFAGVWLKHPRGAANEAVFFRQVWKLEQSPQEAWLRLATNRYFDLFVNGVRLSSQNPYAPDLDSGQWIIGRHRGLDPQDRPTLLDPDEVDSPFIGDNYESPPTVDPTRDDFHWLPRSSAEVKFSTDQTELSFASKHASVRQREWEQTGHTHAWSFPKGIPPQSHQHDRQLGGYVAYDVSRLVHQGDNLIELRLAEAESMRSMHWPAHVAIDGLARMASRDQPLLHNTWRVRSQSSPHWARPIATPLSDADLAALPRLQFRGKMRSSRNNLRQTIRFQIGALATTGILCSVIVGLFIHCAAPDQRDTCLVQGSRMMFGVFAACSAALLAAVLLRNSFAERHEVTWFGRSETWMCIFLACCWFGILAGWGDLWGRRRKIRPGRIACKGLTVRAFPKTVAWPVLIVVVLACGLGVRAYRLDFQPLDDDEYASTQVILSIAENGLPEYAADGVWYTRSPLFHYTVAACAAVFGPNLWSLRIPSVLFGVATCWLTYLFGSRLLRSPWVGMGAMILMALHPFEVFTGHVVRFYQMQQFMALLTVYFFCRGFVTDQSHRYRYLTVVAFLATVLCQEASCTMGFSLLLGYLVFAKDKGAEANLKLVLLSLTALVVIALDYLVFQSRCMTRLSGVSPNLEATITPHFWHPLNFFALLIGYSRLHVVGSLFLLAGIPLLCRHRHRNTMALYLTLASAVAMTNLWVTHVSLRYQYWLIPIWALLALVGLRALLQRACAYGLDLRHEPRRHRRLLAVTSFAVFVALLGSLSPWRIPGSYDMKVLGDSTGAMRFIGQRLGPGDRVMVTEPHTHAALLETGRVDYDLSVPLLYDYAVLQDGTLVDRNGGAEVIGDLRHLSEVMQRHDRVWIAVNREKFRNRGKNIHWEYPAARVELFLRRNCQLVHQTYLWSVFLWDVEAGSYVSFRQGRI